MEYVHSRKVIHRDLKCENILLNESLEPVICDFGLAALTPKGVANQMNIGTPKYMAPELFVDDYNDEYTGKVDVYAYAVILYEMFTDSMKLDDNPGKPFVSLQQLLLRVSKGFRFVHVDAISPWYWALIQRCWSQGPDLRPQFREIVDLFLSHRSEYVIPGTNMDVLSEYEKRIQAHRPPVPPSSAK
jgi:serine/threonine protein kinase